MKVMFKKFQSYFFGLLFCLYLDLLKIIPRLNFIIHFVLPSKVNKKNRKKIETKTEKKRKRKKKKKRKSKEKDHPFFPPFLLFYFVLKISL
jgi:hypothetical protein